MLTQGWQRVSLGLVELWSGLEEGLGWFQDRLESAEDRLEMHILQPIDMVYRCMYHYCQLFLMKFREIFLRLWRFGAFSWSLQICSLQTSLQKLMTCVISSLYLFCSLFFRGADPGGDKGYKSPSHFRVGGTQCDGVPPTFSGNLHA